MTLDKLIEALEKATGPSRELDAEIAAAVDFRADDGHLSARATVTKFGAAYLAERSQSHQNIWSHVLPRYTASLDAAITLVPDGYLWMLHHGIQSTAIVWSLESDYDEGHPRPTGQHEDSPAIALTLACMKARKQ